LRGFLNALAKITKKSALCLRKMHKIFGDEKISLAKSGGKLLK